MTDNNSEVIEEGSSNNQEEAIVGDKVEAANNLDGRDADFAALPVAELQKQLAEQKDKYLRSVADFENFKKRAQKERSELIRYQGERILVDMLDVLDNLERALQHLDSSEEAPNSKLKEGLDLIHKQFVSVLTKWEVRPDSGIGKSFDPNKHQAIGQVASAEAAPGTVVGEMKKAYFYKDKLLRVGDVIVSKSADGA